MKKGSIAFSLETLFEVLNIPNAKDYVLCSAEVKRNQLLISIASNREDFPGEKQTHYGYTTPIIHVVKEVGKKGRFTEWGY